LTKLKENYNILLAPQSFSSLSTRKEEKMKGGVLDLFQKYTESDQELLEDIAARILTLLVVHHKNGNFQELVEARNQYPDAYKRVMTVVCERASIPEGLEALIRVYLTIQDRTLYEILFEKRQRALFSDWDPPALRVFKEMGVMKEFANDTKRRRR